MLPQGITSKLQINISEIDKLIKELLEEGYLTIEEETPLTQLAGRCLFTIEGEDMHLEGSEGGGLEGGGLGGGGSSGGGGDLDPTRDPEIDQELQKLSLSEKKEQSTILSLRGSLMKLLSQQPPLDP